MPYKTRFVSIREAKSDARDFVVLAGDIAYSAQGLMVLSGNSSITISGRGIFLCFGVGLQPGVRTPTVRNGNPRTADEIKTLIGLNYCEATATYDNRFR
jgi:hypothetical protein